MIFSQTTAQWSGGLLSNGGDASTGRMAWRLCAAQEAKARRPGAGTGSLLAPLLGGGGGLARVVRMETESEWWASSGSGRDRFSAALALF